MDWFSFLVGGTKPNLHSVGNEPPRDRFRNLDQPGPRDQCEICGRILMGTEEEVYKVVPNIIVARIRLCRGCQVETYKYNDMMARRYYSWRYN